MAGAKAHPGVATHEGQPPSSREDLAHGNSARASQYNLLQKSKSQAEVAQQRCERFGDRQGPEKSETRSRARMNGGLGFGDATPSNRGRGAGTTRRSGADEGGQAFGSSRAPRRVMPSRRHRVYPRCWRKKLSSMEGSLGRESVGIVMGSSVEAVLATTTIGVAATGGSAVRSFTTCERTILATLARNDPP